MNRRTICVVTGTRADYGLLQGLMKEIQADVDLQLQVIATGMHLSQQFGLTFRDIEQDGFVIDEKIEILLSSDSSMAVTKSVGLATISFADVFNRLHPDLLVILGDRTEALAAAQAAMIARIPIAHLHGGEVTEGAIDESIRHSITKMAHLHFVAAETYHKRVIQLGEQPNRVFNFGSLGIENIRRLQLRNRKELESSLQVALGNPTFLVTYHPATVKEGTTGLEISQLIEAIEEFPEATVIITKPNSDSEGQIIIDQIEQYAQLRPSRVKVFASLGQINYLSMVQECDVVIGNSSSGLIEVPSFKKATVNIGSRQTGRLKAESVIDCDSNKDSIVMAIRKALSPEFQQILQDVVTPYDEGMPSLQIKDQLKKVDLSNLLIKKFNDMF